MLLPKTAPPTATRPLAAHNCGIQVHFFFWWSKVLDPPICGPGQQLQSEFRRRSLSGPCDLAVFAMATNATAFTSPLANSNYGSLSVPPQVEYIVDAVSNVSFWTAVWTLLAVAVVYDQSRPSHFEPGKKSRALADGTVQLATLGAKVQLSDLPGSCLLWDLSLTQLIPSLRNTMRNG